MSKSLIFRIPNIHCSSCVRLVEQSVSSFKNIEDLTIDEKTGIGEMMLENDSNLREIIKAIDEAGYAVELL